MASQTGGSLFGSFLPLILIFFVFYFIVIRPQQKKEKERKQMISALKKGDQIITSGGIYGMVVNLKPETIELKIDENTRVQLGRSFILQVINKTEQQGEVVTGEIVK